MYADNGLCKAGVNCGGSCAVFLWAWIKQSEAVKDRYIPLINGGLGIVICGIYVLATSTCRSGRGNFHGNIYRHNQGILLAGLSTYVNQIIKQIGRGGIEGGIHGVSLF